MRAITTVKRSGCDIAQLVEFLNGSAEELLGGGLFMVKVDLQDCSMSFDSTFRLLSSVLSKMEFSCTAALLYCLFCSDDYTVKVGASELLRESGPSARRAVTEDAKSDVKRSGSSTKAARRYRFLAGFSC